MINENENKDMNTAETLNEEIAMPMTEPETAEKATADAEVSQPDQADQKPEEKKEIYAFRWTYCDQYVHDNEAASESDMANKGKKGRGVAKHLGIYLGVMLIAFSFAFSVLALSLNFDNMAEWFADDPLQTLTVSEIAEKGMPSSVAIYTRKGSSSYSAGSGFVISEYGYIVTNYHVVENASVISVVDSENHQYEASLVGYHKENDIAVLYVENCKLPAVKLGDSDSLTLGETLVAIGTPGGEECAFSVSDGIVSGLNRTVPGKSLGMIQTNTPLNPGNSGGPLFDSQGNLVGIVTLKYTFTNVNEGGQKLPYEGISFALPINGVLNDINGIINDDLDTPKIGITVFSVDKGESYFYVADEGYAYKCERGGINDYYIDSNNDTVLITDEMRENENNFFVDAHASGLLVTDVMEGFGADGVLTAGDIITEANGVAVRTASDFSSVLVTMESGELVTVVINRNGHTVTETIVLMTKLDGIGSSN